MATVSPCLAVTLLVAFIFAAVEATESSSRADVSNLPVVPVVRAHMWQPIKGERLRSQKVWDIAHFAVTTHNSKNGGGLQLVSVDEGEGLNVGGIVYHLYLTVTNKWYSGEKKFHTFVFMYPGTRWQSILFEPLRM